jgi:hypothetical protein
MTKLDELMELGPQVSQLRHDLAVERRQHLITHERLAAALTEVASLHKSLALLRRQHDDYATPAMGTDQHATTAITRRNREHG